MRFLTWRQLDRPRRQEGPGPARGVTGTLSRFGVKPVLVRDDAELRGIPASALMPEAEQISREQLADFLQGFDIVWHW